MNDEDDINGMNIRDEDIEYEEDWGFGKQLPDAKDVGSDAEEVNVVKGLSFDEFNLSMLDIPDKEIEYQKDDGNNKCDGGGCTI